MGASDEWPRLTAVVITRNEAEDLPRCLDALRWADATLVVDDLSTDDTPAIAACYGRVVQRRLDGFDAQRNAALELVETPWALFVDADEVIPSALAEEIRRELAAPRADSYAVVRRNWFLDRHMSRGGWQRDQQVRLGRVGKGRWRNSVHEHWIFEAPPVVLATPLEHYGDRRYADRLTKSNQYSSMVAEQMHAAGKRATLATLFTRPVWKAGKSYVAKQGFREGRHGLVWAGHVLLAEFAAQVKLWELQRDDPSAAGPR